MGNKYQDFRCAQQEPKVKPVIAQATPIIEKVMKVLKPKVSVPTLSKDTIGKYGYTSNIYSHNSKYTYITTVVD